MTTPRQLGTADEMRAYRELQQRDRAEWTEAWHEMHRQRLIYGTAAAIVWPSGHQVGDISILVWNDAAGLHFSLRPRFAWLRRRLPRAIARCAFPVDIVNALP